MYTLEKQNTFFSQSMCNMVAAKTELTKEQNAIVMFFRNFSFHLMQFTNQIVDYLLLVLSSGN